QAGTVATQAPAHVDRRQLRAGARQVDALGLLHLLDEGQGLVGVRQCGLGPPLAQLALGLPHLVERGFQRGAGLWVEQGRGLGVIVGVAVLGQYVVVAAEAGRRALVGLIVVVVVQGGGTCVVGLWLRLGRRVGGG